MAIFTIPEEYEYGLTLLISLSDEEVQELLSALEATTPSLRYRTVVDRIAPHISIKRLEKGHLLEIFEVLFALNSLRIGAEVPTEFFVEDICEAVEESNLLEDNTDEERAETANLLEKFKPNLTKLLESKTIEIASKAGVLMKEQGHMYCSARIVSDVRSVFGESVDAAPEAAMIVHVLKLTYHQGDELKDFFVGLNTKDVQRLRQLLDRADAKTESLKSLIGASGTRYVDAE